MKLFTRLVFLLVFYSLSIFTQQIPQVKKEVTRNILHITGTVIRHAHRIAATDKADVNDLTEAIAHQQLAIRFYHEGNYYKAIQHSRFARSLAIAVVKANKGEVMPDWGYTKEEESNLKNGPSDEALSTELKKETPKTVTQEEGIDFDKIPDVDLMDGE